jgi:glycosyltransferase involved in cell wall biosynthesis
VFFSRIVYLESKFGLPVCLINLYNNFIMMKNLLIIAYYYPPAAVVGANRILRFVKYLPSFGWQSTVVTVYEKYYDLNEDPLDNNFHDGFSIYRTSTIVISDVHRVYKTSTDGGLQASGLKYKEKKGGIKQFLQTYLSIPDTRAGWIPSAVFQSLKILREKRIDAVLTTSFPYSAHVVGLILKSIKNVFWLADFRDPWAEYAFLYPNTSFHKKISYYLERKVITNANVVIANTIPARDKLRVRYSKYTRKIHAITNGYDQEDFDTYKSFENKTENKFVILHAGTVQAERQRRYPIIFFQAFAEFIKKYPDIQDKILLKFIGHIHYTIDLDKLAEDHGITSNVLSTGWVNHKRAIKEMLCANILLLIHHSNEAIPELFSTIPAKTYEYIAAKKPVLCLTSNGSVGKFISNGGFGLSVSPINKNGIIEALECLYFEYDCWVSKLNNNSSISRYEAKELTRELIHLLPS